MVVLSVFTALPLPLEEVLDLPFVCGCTGLSSRELIIIIGVLWCGLLERTGLSSIPHTRQHSDIVFTGENTTYSIKFYE